MKITNEMDTKTNRINDLKLRYYHNLISTDLFNKALKYLKQNKRIQYFVDNNGLVKKIKYITN
jgi:hypothetical protein